MHPILFRIGPYTLYSYTVALLLGIVVGTLLAYRRARSRLADPGIVLDAVFWTVLGGVLGGRAGHVAANWAYYRDHVGKALSLRAGGLSWHAALLGATVAFVVWYAARSRTVSPMPDWRDLLDVMAPGLALGSAFVWLGCLLTGACYGAEAIGVGPPLSWLTADLRDIFGVDQVRFATQPIMIVWCLLLWGLLSALSDRLPRGIGFMLYLLLYASADLVLGFLRGDGVWRSGLWLGQWTSLAVICLALALGACILSREDRERS